eukprot:comp17808_c0_seq1/m.17884 comp17808_c0_seq1/g.17884  ORF comp17808_c0_seq1/g.17884 comp17808_c0_seq1/m.17884 type:complete len:535 (-) comp17808_c0_seq1:55-1659(-)
MAEVASRSATSDSRGNGWNSTMSRSQSTGPELYTIERSISSNKRVHPDSLTEGESEKRVLNTSNEHIFRRASLTLPIAMPAQEHLFGEKEGEGVGSRFQPQLNDITQWFGGLSQNKQQQVFSRLIGVTERRLPVISKVYRDLAPMLKVDFVAKLPDKLAKYILSFCDAKSLCMAAAVSKRWRQIANDDSLWHRMCAQHINKKCTKCGWGLPLIADDPRGKRRKIVWKDIYADRQRVELNWRKGSYSTHTLQGHTGGVLCLEVCVADGLLVSGGEDNVLRVWDLNTNTCVRVMTGHTGPVKCLQFDKVKIVSGSYDGSIRIWALVSSERVQAGECVRTMEANTGGVMSLQFDDEHLVSGGADSNLRLWSFSDAKMHILRGHTDVVNCVQLCGKKAVSGSDDYTIRLWDLAAHSCLRVLEGHMGEVMCVQMAHETLMSGSLDNTVKIWKPCAEKCTTTLFGHTGGVYCMQFDSLRIVTGSQDGTVIIWDRQTGKPLHTLTGHSGPISALMFTDTKIVTGLDDGTMRIWDFSARQQA